MSGRAMRRLRGSATAFPLGRSLAVTATRTSLSVWGLWRSSARVRSAPEVLPAVSSLERRQAFSIGDLGCAPSGLPLTQFVDLRLGLLLSSRDLLCNKLLVQLTTPQLRFLYALRPWTSENCWFDTTCRSLGTTPIVGSIMKIHVASSVGTDFLPSLWLGALLS